jgi:hypothetical protein
VHARSVAAAAIDGVTGDLFQSTLTPAHDHIGDWVRSLPSPVAVAYEAGPTGFGLFRSLTAAGIRCEVAAPSKLQKHSGDRVKTDAKDALHLTRLLRLDEVTAVSVPTIEQETAGIWSGPAGQPSAAQTLGHLRPARQAVHDRRRRRRPRALVAPATAQAARGAIRDRLMSSAHRDQQRPHGCDARHAHAPAETSVLR